MIIGLVRGAHEMKQCLYKVTVADVTSVKVSDLYNQTQGLLEKSKVAQYAYEEGHEICWKEATVL
jgi:hypothetical protein